MTIECECGGSNVVEVTTSLWNVDSNGQRESRKCDDVTSYYCGDCGLELHPANPQHVSEGRA